MRLVPADDLPDVPVAERIPEASGFGHPNDLRGLAERVLDLPDRVGTMPSEDLRMLCNVLAIHLRSAADRATKVTTGRAKALADAERRVTNTLARMHAEGFAEGLDPQGYFVYALWGADDTCPLYVGSSGNVLARLGSHLSEPAKRYAVQRVTLLRCPTHRQMITTESRLIALYQPPWNIRGCEGRGA